MGLTIPRKLSFRGAGYVCVRVCNCTRQQAWIVSALQGAVEGVIPGQPCKVRLGLAKPWQRAGNLNSAPLLCRTPSTQAVLALPCGALLGCGVAQDPPHPKAHSPGFPTRKGNVPLKKRYFAAQGWHGGCVSLRTLRTRNFVFIKPDTLRAPCPLPDSEAKSARADNGQPAEGPPCRQLEKGERGFLGILCMLEFWLIWVPAL